jgi:predicted TIM-barrel fold metal-dependent hydrolase
MIIDTHYHMIPQLGSRASKAVARWPFFQAQKLGLDIDFNTLVEEVKNTYADPTGERLIERMDTAGIDVTAFCAVDNSRLPGNTYEVAKALNQQVGSIAKNFPDRFIAFAGIDPRRPEAPDLLKYCLEEFGMKGLKFHPDHGYYPNSPEAYRMLEILQQDRGILLTHTGPGAPPDKAGKYAHPLLLDEIAVDFPDVTIIAAHMGQYWWREWAGSAYYQPNLFGDLAEWQILAKRNFKFFCNELRQVIDICGEKKVLFGSDGPIFEPIVPVQEWINLMVGLPYESAEGTTFKKEEIDAIMGGNAQRILSI